MHPFEKDNGPYTNKQLGAALVGSVFKMMAIKWTVILVVTKLAKRAARKIDC